MLLQKLKRLFGTILMIGSALFLFVGFLCFICTLIGLMEIPTFGEWLFHLVIYMVLTVFSAFWIRIGFRMRKKTAASQPAAEETPAPPAAESPAVVPVPAAAPQPIQPAPEHQPKPLLQEKPVQREYTVPDAIAALPRKDQKQQQVKMQRYAQDIRNGMPAEKAASKEKLVKADEKIVTPKVASQLEAMKNSRIPEANPFERAQYPHEIPGPQHSSKFEAESKYFLFLSDAHLARELGWGQQEFFALKTDTFQPFYVISQYDGAAVAQTWYHVRQPVSWEEVEYYGDPACKCQLINTPNAKWSSLAVRTIYSANGLRIAWRISRGHNWEAEIRITEDGYLLSSFDDNPSHKKLQQLLPRSIATDEAAYRRLMPRFSLHKEYVIGHLWNFIQRHKHMAYVPASREDMRNATHWLHLYGDPSHHGTQIRLGRSGNTFYLEVTDDGYPNRMGGGGFAYFVPRDAVSDGRLKVHEFADFLNSILHGAPIINYSAFDWFLPVPEKPQGSIEVVRVLHNRETRGNSGYSFEITDRTVEVVRCAESLFVRVTGYSCSAEANGRPVTTQTEDYYAVTTADPDQIMPSNWVAHVACYAAYHNVSSYAGTMR